MLQKAAVHIMGITERREREKTMRRNAIIEGAEELFFRNGYDKTRMLEIADYCELSKGSLYLYFNNKEDLAHAVVSRSHSILLNLLQEGADRGETGLEKVKEMLEAFVTFYGEYNRAFSLSFLLESKLRSVPPDGHRWTDYIDRIHALTAAVLRQGMHDGSIRSDIDPELAAITYMNAAEGFFHRIAFRSKMAAIHGYSAEQLVRELFTILANSLTPTVES